MVFAYKFSVKSQTPSNRETESHGSYKDSRVALVKGSPAFYYQHYRHLFNCLSIKRIHHYFLIYVSGGIKNMLEKLSFYSALIFVFIIGILAFILLLMGQNLRDWYLRARNRPVVT
jgi:hypothetical protein